MESLEATFKKLIAIQDRIDPDQVTPQYIREQREERIDPFIRPPLIPGLTSLTREELDQIGDRLDEIMAEV